MAEDVNLALSWNIQPIRIEDLNLILFYFQGQWRCCFAKRERSIGKKTVAYPLVVSGTTCLRGSVFISRYFGLLPTMDYACTNKLKRVIFGKRLLMMVKNSLCHL